MNPAGDATSPVQSAGADNDQVDPAARCSGHEGVRIASTPPPLRRLSR
jgi:hypothetical protein